MALIDPDMDGHLDDFLGIKHSLPAAGSSKKGSSAKARAEQKTFEELAEIKMIDICEKSETIRKVLQKANATQSEKKSAHEFIEKKLAESNVSSASFNTNKIGKKLAKWKADLRTKIGMAVAEDEDFLTDRDKQLMKIFDMKIDSVTFMPRFVMDSGTTSPDDSLLDASESETNSSKFSMPAEEYAAAEDTDEDDPPKKGNSEKRAGAAAFQSQKKTAAHAQGESGAALVTIKSETGSDEDAAVLPKARKSKEAGASSNTKRKGFAGSCPPAKKPKADIEDLASRMMESQSTLTDKLISSQKESQQAALEAAKEENRLVREHEAAMMAQILGALRQPQYHQAQYFPMPYYQGAGSSQGGGPQFPSPGGGNNGGIFQKRQ